MKGALSDDIKVFVDKIISNLDTKLEELVPLREYIETILTQFYDLPIYIQIIILGCIAITALVGTFYLFFKFIKTNAGKLVLVGTIAYSGVHVYQTYIH